MKFELNDKEETDYLEFSYKHRHDKKKKYLAGGNITVSFTPNGIASAVEVSCACGITKDISDYEAW